MKLLQTKQVIHETLQTLRKLSLTFETFQFKSKSSSSQIVIILHLNKFSVRGEQKQRSIERTFMVVNKNITNEFFRWYTNHFYVSGVLHVSYAPEYETINDLREKIESRKRNVQFRLRKLDKDLADTKPTINSRKRTKGVPKDFAKNNKKRKNS